MDRMHLACQRGEHTDSPRRAHPPLEARKTSETIDWRVELWLTSRYDEATQRKGIPLVSLLLRRQLDEILLLGIKL